MGVFKNPGDRGLIIVKKEAPEYPCRWFEILSLRGVINEGVGNSLSHL
jgi:hypothetical protein